MNIFKERLQQRRRQRQASKFESDVYLWGFCVAEAASATFDYDSTSAEFSTWVSDKDIPDDRKVEFLDKVGNIAARQIPDEYGAYYDRVATMARSIHIEPSPSAEQITSGEVIAKPTQAEPMYVVIARTAGVGKDIQAA